MDENLTIDQDRIMKINIEEEMKTSYIDYSMSVIVARALPDVRDGFKPVHRRILYGMLGLGNTSDKPYKKCARVVGEVLGKYHPWTDKVTSVVSTVTHRLPCVIRSAACRRWVSISWTISTRIPLTWSTTSMTR